MNRYVLCAALLLIVCFEWVCSTPTFPTRLPLPVALSGQSNAEGLAPYLQTAYGPVVGAWASGLSIDFWSPADRMWTALLPTLHQPLTAFVWWQGESDAATAETYRARLATFLAQVRVETQQPALFIVVIRVAPDPAFTGIRAAQEAWVTQDIHALLVSCDDLPFIPGEVHLTSAGYQQMAQRVAAVLR